MWNCELGTELASKNCKGASYLFVPRLVGSRTKNRAEIPSGGALNSEEGRGPNHVRFKLLSRMAALMRDRIAKQNDAFQFPFVAALKITEGKSASKECLSPLLGVVIREPVYVGSTAQHYIAGHCVRPEGNPRQNITTRPNALREEADEQVLHEALECRDCPEEDALVEKCGIVAGNMPAIVQTFYLCPRTIETT